MLLVGEARHGVIRLRLEPHANDTALGGGRQHRQARRGEEIVDERGQEHRLAGARQPGHADAQRAAAKIIPDRSGDEPRLEQKIAET